MTPDYEELLRSEPSFLDPWLKELAKQHQSETCIPTVTDDDETPSPRHSGVADRFFDKAINRIPGGPPPRGKPKPETKEISATSGEAAEAIHRAMNVGRR